MITRDDVISLWTREAPVSWPDNQPFPHTEPHDFGDFWFVGFESGVVGSMGLLVDKSDGHMNWLGSAYGWNTWLYAHRCGFTHKAYRWSISEIRDPDRLRKLLVRLRFDVEAIDLSRGSLELPFTWIGYNELPEIAAADWIDYSFTVTACDWADCKHIGCTIFPFQPRPV